MTTLKRRIADPAIHTEEVRFRSPLGKVRNRSNTTGEVRWLFDRVGFDWVTSHTFRKTVATRLDEAGISARQVVDQLGHRNPSMTTDVYLGRKSTVAAAAEILARRPRAEPAWSRSEARFETAPRRPVKARLRALCGQQNSP